MDKCPFIKFRSIYSILRSNISIDDILKNSKESGLSTICITDFQSLSGIVEFYRKSIIMGIKPIIGCDFLFNGYYISVIVRNNDGLQQLINLLNTMAIKDQSFEESLIYNKQDNNILLLPLELKDKNISKFNKDNFNKILFSTEFHNKNKTHINSDIEVATVHFIYKKHTAYIEILDTIRDDKHQSINIQNYFPEINFNEYSKNSLISEECNVSLETFYNTKVIKLPEINEDNKKVDIRQICLKFLKEINATQVYFERLEHELNIIKELSFEEYFIIVYELVLFCKKEKITIGPGRGSCVGSLICYCLNITLIDPIKYGLIFERFINKYRVSLPDIDLDIDPIDRNKIFKFLQQKKGIEFLHISTFMRMKFKSALKDIARCTKLISFGAVNFVAKLCEDEEEFNNFYSKLVNIKNKYEKNIDLNHSEKDLINIISDEKGPIRFSTNLEYFKKIVEIVPIFLNCLKSVSVHPSGIIVAENILIDKIPIFKQEIQDEICYVSQFDMESIEYLGYIKFDILGLDTLHMLKRLSDRTGEELDYKKFIEDKKTFKMLSKGFTKGVFQLDKDFASQVLEKMQPEKFEDIVAFISLNRPGPIDYIDIYIKRKKDITLIDYPHNILKDILEETYGIIIYQEQVMRISQVTSNYSMFEADNLRRSIGKKKIDIMENEENIFIKRSIISYEDSKKIFDIIKKFAGYGFNKSHAVAYSAITLATAYFKAHFPKLFLEEAINIDKERAEIYARDVILFNSSLRINCKESDSLLLPLFIIKGLSNNLINLDSIELQELYGYLPKETIIKLIEIGVIILNKNKIIIDKQKSIEEFILEEKNRKEKELNKSKGLLTLFEFENVSYIKNTFNTYCFIINNQIINEIKYLGFPIIYLNIASFFNLFIIDDVVILFISQKGHFINLRNNRRIFVSSEINHLSKYIGEVILIDKYLGYIMISEIFKEQGNIFINLDSEIIGHLFKKNIVLNINNPFIDEVIDNIKKSVIFHRTVNYITIILKNNNEYKTKIYIYGTIDVSEFIKRVLNFRVFHYVY